MIEAITKTKMKELEALSDKNGVSYFDLMKNAGTCAGKFIKKKMSENGFKSVIFLCGSGNNGGDCFISAAYLKEKGIDAKIFLVQGLPKTEIANKAYNKALKSGVKILSSLPQSCDVCCDGIFGTGFHGTLPKQIAFIFKNLKAKLNIAVDIPSGGSGTNGEADKNTFRADFTLTFGYAKTGLFQFPLAKYCGNVVTLDIGFPEGCSPEKTFSVLDEKGVLKMLPKRPEVSNKGTFGNLLCLTGCENMPGACALSTLSALKGGAGLVTVATAKENIKILASNIYSPVWKALDTDENGFINYSENNKMILEKQLAKSTACLIGCGLGVTDDTKSLVKWIIKTCKCPLIIDADGLNCIADFIDILNEAKCKIIITPHPGEASRLSGVEISNIQNGRINYAIDFSKKYPATVLVLKGAGTIIAQNGRGYIDASANSGLAKGGSGDVLAGIISSLCAQGTNPLEAAALGVYIHSVSAALAAKKLSCHAMQPRDIIEEYKTFFLKAE